MKYLYEEFLKPINIEPEIEFLKIQNINENQILDLAKMYCTLFNYDNKNVLSSLNIKEKPASMGIWLELPYDLKRCEKIINNFVNDNYFGVVALGKGGSRDVVLGASVYQIKDLKSLQDKLYSIPFDIPDNADFWCEIDTFRRETFINGQKLDYLSLKMRNKTLEYYKKSNPILIFSSTNNPVMVKAWKKDSFIIIEKPTSFGNKFQSFKLVV